MKFNKTQIVVIIGTLLIVVLLLFANTKIPKKEPEKIAQQESPEEVSFEQLLENTKNKLPAEAKNMFSQEEKTLQESKDSNAFNAAINKWEGLQQPLVVAYFSELKAHHFPSETNWQNAAYRYYTLTSFAEAENYRAVLYKKAMTGYEKTLELNPRNIDARIDLASCYVLVVNPMQGIGMLREIEKEHPDNVKVQYTLAFFSMQSGQLEKAIERFEKILKLQPDNIDVYYNIGDAYERMKNNEKAIEYYEKYVSHTTNPNAKEEVQGYINKLKKN